MLPYHSLKAFDTRRRIYLGKIAELPEKYKYVVSKVLMKIYLIKIWDALCDICCYIMSFFFMTLVL